MMSPIAQDIGTTQIYMQFFQLVVDEILVTESGKQEKHLVTTVGKFSVVWNFQQVRNSSHTCYQNQQGLESFYCYKIVPKDESIIESRFIHDKFAFSNSPEAPLAVVTPMKVTSISMFGKR